MYPSIPLPSAIPRPNAASPSGIPRPSAIPLPSYLPSSPSAVSIPLPSYLPSSPSAVSIPRPGAFSASPSIIRDLGSRPVLVPLPSYIPPSPSVMARPSYLPVSPSTIPRPSAIPLPSYLPVSPSAIPRPSAIPLPSYLPASPRPSAVPIPLPSYAASPSAIPRPSAIPIPRPSLLPSGPQSSVVQPSTPPRRRTPRASKYGAPDVFPINPNIAIEVLRPTASGKMKRSVVGGIPLETPMDLFVYIKVEGDNVSIDPGLFKMVTSSEHPHYQIYNWEVHYTGPYKFEDAALESIHDSIRRTYELGQIGPLYEIRHTPLTTDQMAHPRDLTQRFGHLPTIQDSHAQF